jgi:flavin-dependent dehydrogenase
MRFHGIRYLNGDDVAEARFCGGHGLGARRTTLHRALVERAEDVGVRLDWGVRALGLRGDQVETSAGRASAEWVIAADGLRSRMRRWAELEGDRSSGLRRIGVRRHFRIEPWTDLVEVYWSDDCEAYVTPVGSQETGVAVLSSGAALGFEAGLARFPALERRLLAAPVVSTDRGAGPLWRRARKVHSGRLALVGDAAGYLDAITGEGLALGFHQADALAGAIEAGDLRLYQRAFRKMVSLPFTLVRLLLFAERHPAIRRRVVRALAREPELFSRLLAIHTRDRPPRSLGVGGALRFVRGLVRASSHRAS